MTVNTGGLVVFTGSGPAASDFSVARNFFGNTGVTSTGVADFSPGTFVGDLRDLVIAYKDNTAGVGNAGGATGTFTLGTSAANLVNATNLRIAEKLSDSSGAVNGTLNIGGGLVAVSGDATAGVLGAVTINTGNATGTINLNGGSLDIGGNLLLGSRTVSGNARALGNLNVNSGTAIIGGNITTTNATEAVATVVLNGGTLDVTGGSINVDTLTVQSGTLRNVAEIYTGDGISTLGTLTKSAAGTLNLEGTNTFSAETVVNAGSLLVGGSITGVVKVGATALLGGTGTILGSVTIADGATISPGASIGNLRTGMLDLQNNSAFTLEIDTTARTTDHVAVAGTLNIDPVGTVKLAISDLNPAIFGAPLPFITYEAWNGGLFTVNGTIIDDYDQLFNPDSAMITVGGNQYRVDYDYGGNSVALFIPEPASFLSILGGLGVLLGTRRRGKGESAE
jgi:autotransporter-associated beta strand protein